MVETRVGDEGWLDVATRAESMAESTIDGSNTAATLTATRWVGFGLRTATSNLLTMRCTELFRDPMFLLVLCARDLWRFGVLDLNHRGSVCCWSSSVLDSRVYQTTTTPP